MSRTPTRPDLSDAGVEPMQTAPAAVRVGLEFERRGIKPPEHIDRITREFRRRGLVGQEPFSPQPFDLDTGEQRRRAAARYGQIDETYEPPSEEARGEHVTRRMDDWLGGLADIHRQSARHAGQPYGYEQRQELWRSLDQDQVDAKREEFGEEWDAEHSAAGELSRQRQAAGQDLIEFYRESHPEASDRDAYQYMHEELARLGYQPPGFGPDAVVDQQGLEEAIGRIRDAQAPLVDRGLSLGGAGDVVAGALQAIPMSFHDVVGTFGVGGLATAFEKQIGDDLGLRAIQRNMQEMYVDRPQREGLFRASERPGLQGDYQRFMGTMGQVATDLGASLVLSGLGVGAAKAAGMAARTQRVSGLLAGMGYMGAREGGGVARQSYDQLRLKGLDHETANDRAMMAGVSAGAINGLIGAIPGNQFMFRNPQMRSRLSGALHGMIAEGSTEAAQEFIATAAEFEAGAGEGVWNWDFAKQLVTASLAGGIVGGAVGAGQGGRGFQSRVAQEAAEERERLIIEVQQQAERAHREARRSEERRQSERVDPRRDPEGERAGRTTPETTEPPRTEPTGGRVDTRSGGRRDPKVIATPAQMASWYERSFTDPEGAQEVRELIERQGERFRLVDIPLDLLPVSEQVERGEVDPGDVDEIAQLDDQSVADLPPVIAYGDLAGGLRLADGRKRTAGLQQRFDELEGQAPATIRGYVPESVAQQLEAGDQAGRPGPPPPPPPPEGEATRAEPDDARPAEGEEARRDEPTGREDVTPADPPDRIETADEMAQYMADRSPDLADIPADQRPGFFQGMFAEVGEAAQGPWVKLTLPRGVFTDAPSDPALVEQYRQMREQGQTPPPIVAAEVNEQPAVIDGKHRLAAGDDPIEVYVPEAQAERFQQRGEPEQAQRPEGETVGREDDDVTPEELNSTAGSIVAQFSDRGVPRDRIERMIERARQDIEAGEDAQQVLNALLEAAEMDTAAHGIKNRAVRAGRASELLDALARMARGEAEPTQPTEPPADQRQEAIEAYKRGDVVPLKEWLSEHDIEYRRLEDLLADAENRQKHSTASDLMDRIEAYEARIAGVERQQEEAGGPQVLEVSGDVLQSPEGGPPQTGQPIAAELFRGHGRADQEDVYAAGTDGPAFGPGRYYALTEQDARPFGPQVERERVELQNPLVLTSNRELMQWLEGGLPSTIAGWREALPAMRQRMRDAGHDGLIVNVPQRGDVNTAGESAKRLRDLAGISQVVVFDTDRPAQAEPPTTEPTQEWIVASATRHPETGEVFTGAHHGESREKAGLMPPDDPSLRSPDGDEADGFVTNTGRFVSREEAGAIAAAARQIETGEAGVVPLAQEDLDAHQEQGPHPQDLRNELNELRYPDLLKRAKATLGDDGVKALPNRKAQVLINAIVEAEARPFTPPGEGSAVDEALGRDDPTPRREAEPEESDIRRAYDSTMNQVRRFTEEGDTGETTLHLEAADHVLTMFVNLGHAPYYERALADAKASDTSRIDEAIGLAREALRRATVDQEQGAVEQFNQARVAELWQGVDRKLETVGVIRDLIAGGRSQQIAQIRLNDLRFSDDPDVDVDDHRLRLQGVEPAPEPTQAAPETAPADPKRAATLRKLADGMQRQIDKQLNPGVADQNYTARRARIAEGMRREGERLQRLQAALNALADGFEAGTLPATLGGISTRAQVETLLQAGQFPSLAMRSNQRDDLLKAGEGKAGINDLREAIGQLQSEGRGSVLIRLENRPQAIEAMEAFARKHKNDDRIASVWRTIKAEIADAQRLQKAGINPDNFAQARTDLLALFDAEAMEAREREQREARERERRLRERSGPGYFPTPPAVARSMMFHAEIEPHHTVLEPSAGEGALLRAVEQSTPGIQRSQIHAVEIAPDLVEHLTAEGWNVMQGDFLELANAGELPQVDRIVMNPPFERGQDAIHVRRAYDLLNPGGRIVAIVSEGTFSRDTGADRAFRDWLERVEATTEQLPEGAFTGPDAIKQTGVSSRIVFIEKPSEGGRPDGTEPDEQRVQGQGRTQGRQGPAEAEGEAEPTPEPDQPAEPPEPLPELTPEQARALIDSLAGPGGRLKQNLSDEELRHYTAALRTLDREHDANRLEYEQADTGSDDAQVWWYPVDEDIPGETQAQAKKRIAHVRSERKKIEQEFQRLAEPKRLPKPKPGAKGRTTPTKPTRAKTAAAVRKRLGQFAKDAPSQTRGEVQPSVMVDQDGRRLTTTDGVSAWEFTAEQDGHWGDDGIRSIDKNGSIGGEIEGSQLDKARQIIANADGRLDPRPATVNIERAYRALAKSRIVEPDNVVIMLNPDDTLGFVAGNASIGVAEVDVQPGAREVPFPSSPSHLMENLAMAYAVGADEAQLRLMPRGKIETAYPVLIEARGDGMRFSGVTMLRNRIKAEPQTAEQVRQMGPGDSSEAERSQVRAEARRRDEQRVNPGDPRPSDVFALRDDPSHRVRVMEVEMGHVIAEPMGGGSKLAIERGKFADRYADPRDVAQSDQEADEPPEGDGPGPVSGMPGGGGESRGFDEQTGRTTGEPVDATPSERATVDHRPLEQSGGKLFRRRMDTEKAIRRNLKELVAARQRGVDLNPEDSIYELIDDLQRRFNVGPAAIGRHQMLSRWAAGLYEIEPHRIRLAKGSYVATWVHELGHHLHKTMFPRRTRNRRGEPHHLYSAKDFPKEWGPGLLQLGRDLYGDREPNVGGYTSEGWAETVRFLFTNPAHLKQRTPKLYADVVNMLVVHHPEVWAMVREGRVRLLAARERAKVDPVDQFVAHRHKDHRTWAQRKNTAINEVLDDANPIRVMLDDLGIDPETMPAHRNPHTAALRVRNHIAGDIRAMVEDGIYAPSDPLRRPVGPSLQGVLRRVGNDEDVRRWQNYMVARRVIEKRAQGYDVMPEDARFAMRLGSENLAEFIRRTEAEKPHFAEARRDFQEINRWLIEQYAVHYGLIDNDAASMIVDKNLEYITFRWLKHSEAVEGSGKVAGRRLTGWGTGIRRFNPGKGEQLHPPLESFFASLQGIISRARLNEVARKVILPQQHLPGSGRWFSELTRPMDKTKIGDEQLRQEVMNQLGIHITKDGGISLPPDLEGLTDDQVMALVEAIEGIESATFWKPGKRTDPENLEVTLLDRGKPRFFRVADGELFQTLEGMGSPTVTSNFLRVLRIPATILRKGATQLNPDFFNSNFFRDLWQSITLSESSWKRLGEQFKRRWEATRNVFREGDIARLYKVSGGDMAAIWNEYYNPGTRRYNLHEIRGDAVWGKLPRSASDAWAMLTDVATLGPIARVNDAIESSNRMTEFAVKYHGALERGADTQEAMAEAGQAAADITIDYLRSGRSVRSANQFIVFFNAAIRGPDKLARFIKKNPGRAAGRLFATTIVPSLIQAALNWNNDDYWAQPLEKRDRWWMFPVGYDDEGRPTYLTLPKPYALAVFSIATERSLARMMGIDPETGERGDPGAYDGMLWAILRELRPTLNIAGLQPIMEVAPPRGWSVFWGREIVPQRDADLPKSDQGAEVSSTAAQFLGEMLDYPPAKIDYLIRGWLGGAANTGLFLGDRITEATGAVEPKGPPVNATDWPIIRRFLGTNTRGEHEAIRRFFRDHQQTRAVARGLTYREKVRPESVPTYQKVHEFELAVNPIYESARSDMLVSFERLRTLYRRAGEMDPDELDRQIDAIHDQIVQIAQTAHTQVRRVAERRDEAENP